MTQRARARAHSAIVQHQGHAVSVLLQALQFTPQRKLHLRQAVEMGTQDAFDRRLREDQRRGPALRVRRRHHRHAADQLPIDAKVL